MKNLLLAVGLLLLASCAATTARPSISHSAAPSPSQGSEQSPSGNYLGLKGGPLLVTRDLPYDDGVSVGALFGHQIPDSNLAFEIEATTTVSSLDAELNNFGDLDIFTLGAFGVYRTEGDLYLKAKGGLLYEYLDVGIASIAGEAVNLALGIGGGYRLNDGLAFEVEFTRIDADINFLSFGLNFGI